MSSGKRLPRSVIVLGWVSFFADVSSEMIYPLLPLFIVGALGAPATVLGAIEGAAQAMVAVLTALAGWHSDRIRRRVVYVRIGYGLPVIGKSLLALAAAWPWVLAGRSIDRIGKGLRASPRDALIADVIDPQQRGRAFGYHRAMDTAGAMTGVLLSAAILWWFVPDAGEAVAGAGGDSGSGASAMSESTITTLRWLFAVAAGLGLASLALTFLVKDPEHTESQLHKSGTDASGEDAGRHGGLPHSAAGRALTPNPSRRGGSSTPKGRGESLPRSYWLVLAILVVFALANSSDAFLLLRAGQVGLSPLAVVLAYALYNLTYALASYPAGALSDRFGRWRMIGGGWILYALVYAGFALTGATGVWLLMALYGGYMALTDGVGKALIADHAPAERRATALGIAHMALGMAVLVSSLLAGWLWDAYGPAAPFWFGSIAAAAAVALLVTLRPLIGPGAALRSAPA